MNDKFKNAAPGVIQLKDPEDTVFNRREKVYREGIELERVL